MEHLLPPPMPLSRASSNAGLDSCRWSVLLSVSALERVVRQEHKDSSLPSGHLCLKCSEDKSQSEKRL